MIYALWIGAIFLYLGAGIATVGLIIERGDQLNYRHLLLILFWPAGLVGFFFLVIAICCGLKE